MNQKTWQQITTTVLTTVFGISGLTLISPIKTNAHEVVDALQATNRPRRLLANASPLKEVREKPKPKDIISVKHHTKGLYKGIASWYGPGFHGRLTANGERYNQNALTAAHKTLPFGTRVRVTNLNNGRSVVVRINDRGPFIKGRIIDLSAASARAIGLYHQGVGNVRLDILN